MWGSDEGWVVGKGLGLHMYVWREGRSGSLTGQIRRSAGACCQVIAGKQAGIDLRHKTRLPSGPASQLLQQYSAAPCSAAQRSVRHSRLQGGRAARQHAGRS